MRKQSKNTVGYIFPFPCSVFSVSERQAIHERERERERVERERECRQRERERANQSREIETYIE